ncbi:MAG: COX15/CtaA family protein [Alphaproteobacteria bacterium]|nr:COX15/CtaA family protein [Alphaproteobacteria bacterium]
MTIATLSSAAPAGRSNRPVVAWLFVCCAMIFAMVVIGGITRLTESGLSITEWRPVTGAIPPLSEEAWQAEFARYRQIPQYQQVNAGMTLAEFKAIFWWEYIHRLWGRLIGVAFALPLAWFWITGRIRGRIARQLAGIFVLGAIQGAIGWWMVASGLADRVSVSPYRLATHLVLALVIYAWTLWAALDLLRGAARPADAGAGPLGFLALVFVTIVSGAFVAGNRAGLTYNTFPLMDGRLVPEFYVDPALGSLMQSIFEGVAAVQFNHRVLAIAVVVSALALWLGRRRSAPAGLARAALAAVPIAACAQLALGIATLLLVVPIALGAAHQAGAVLVLTAATLAAHALAAANGARR